MKLHIIGDWIYSSSGYAAHTKGLCNALYKLNPDMSLDCPKPADWVRYVSDNELKFINNKYTEDSTTIMISLPQSWKLALADNPTHFLGFLIWEGDKIPLYWLKYLADERVNGVLVPSQHVYNAIANTIEYSEKTGFMKGLEPIMNKVHIIPHGVDTTLFKPIPNSKETKFTFICNKGLAPNNMQQDRGGIQFIIQAFIEEFKKTEDVNCIVKINITYGTPNIDEFLKQIGLKANTNLKFNFDNVEYKLLPKLYNKGHCFVSATRCDAFNLPGIEAMACGLPTIQTGYGGQTDYMTDKNSLPIGYKLEEVKHDISYEGNKWATPDITDLRKTMRYAFEHQDEIKQMGIQANIDAQKWTWQESAKKLLNILS